MTCAQTELMSTQVSAPSMVRRVAARAGVGMWRQRGGILVGLALIAAVTGYMALGVTGLTGEMPVAAGSGASASATSDCADAAMAAIANKSPGAAQGAYQCMD